MKLLLISILFSSAASADFSNFGDGAKVPAVTVTSSFEDEILTSTTTWMILRDNNCDRSVRTDVVQSVGGKLWDITSSCTYQRLCGNTRGGPAAPVPISCDIFVRNVNLG